MTAARADAAPSLQSHADSFYRRILDGLAEGVVLLDARGSVMVWNAAAAALTGVCEPAAVGRQLSQVALPPLVARVLGDLMRRAVTAGHAAETVDLPLRSRRVDFAARIVRDGSRPRVLLTMREFAPDCAPPEAVQALGRVACAAVHDLSNILAVIMTQAYLLRQADSCPPAAEHAASIERAVVKAAGVSTRALEETRRLMQSTPAAP